MTILEAITQLQSVKPHQYDDETVIRWLSELDNQIYNEVVKWNKDCEDIPHGPYDPNGDLGDTLMVPSPYSDIYIKYLAAQVDYFNGEIARYNNSMVMYNVALSSFADWWNREHMPRQDYRVQI